MSPEDLRDLRDLLGDAVADVEPRDRLGEIRRRTARPAHHRRWPLAVLAAGTATAAVVSAVAVLGDLVASPEEDAPADRPAQEQAAVATYFVGGTANGDFLFREFHPVPSTADDSALTLAALRRLEADAGPSDPDYRTLWPDGAFLDAVVAPDAVVVTISEDAADDPSTTTVDGIQQVVYTAQAAVGRVVPVTLATSRRTVRAQVSRDGSRLTPVNISDPAEGHTVDDLLTVRGTVRPPAAGLATLPWTLVADDKIALSGEAPVTSGSWEQTTDIADLKPGTYELVVSLLVGLDDPTVDTRTVVVR